MQSKTQFSGFGTRFRNNSFLDTSLATDSYESDTSGASGSYTLSYIKSQKYLKHKTDTPVSIKTTDSRFLTSSRPFDECVHDSFDPENTSHSETKASFSLISKIDDKSLDFLSFAISPPNASKLGDFSSQVNTSSKHTLNPNFYVREKTEVYKPLKSDPHSDPKYNITSNVFNQLGSLSISQIKSSNSDDSGFETQNKDIYHEEFDSKSRKHEYKSSDSSNGVQLPQGLFEDEDEPKLPFFLKHNIPRAELSSSRVFSKLFKSDSEKNLSENSVPSLEAIKVDTEKNGLNSFNTYGSKVIDDLSTIPNFNSSSLADPFYSNNKLDNNSNFYCQSKQLNPLSNTEHNNKHEIGTPSLPNSFGMYPNMYLANQNNHSSSMYCQKASTGNESNVINNHAAHLITANSPLFLPHYNQFDPYNYITEETARIQNAQRLKNRQYRANYDHSQSQPLYYQQFQAGLPLSTDNKSYKPQTPQLFYQGNGVKQQPLFAPNISIKPTNLKTKLKPDSDPSLYTNAAVADFKGNILTVCKDQYGCRFLQKKLDQGKPEDIELIFTEILPWFDALMVDSFGNYLCQKFLECCTDQQRLLIVDQVAHNLVEISTNMHGTRAAQKLIEFLPQNNKQQIEKVKNSIKKSVVLLVKDLNGNHVIQKFLTKFGADDIQFIYVSVALNCVQVATHRHGCCVFQRCIDQASESQKVLLVQNITKNALELVQDPFGNYVVQYVLDLNRPDFNEPLIQQFVSHVCNLSMQKFSSNVIEKCIRIASKETRGLLIDPIFNPAKLDLLIRDSFGNYVVQTILDYIDPKKKIDLVVMLRPLLSSIRQTSYGKRIFSKIHQDGLSNIVSAEATSSLSDINFTSFNNTTNAGFGSRSGSGSFSFAHSDSNTSLHHTKHSNPEYKSLPAVSIPHHFENFSSPPRISTSNGNYAAGSNTPPSDTSLYSNNNTALFQNNFESTCDTGSQFAQNQNNSAPNYSSQKKQSFTAAPNSNRSKPSASSVTNAIYNSSTSATASVTSNSSTLLRAKTSNKPQPLSHPKNYQAAIAYTPDLVGMQYALHKHQKQPTSQLLVVDLDPYHRMYNTFSQ